MIPAKSPQQIDYKTFMYLHPSTKGTSGRAVYIDPDLLVRFMELIDLGTKKGEDITHQMCGLKNSAAGNSSDSNLSNAFQHRLTIHNVVVTYVILQNAGRGAGVYITGLQHGYSNDQGRPGLYKATQNHEGRLRWKATPDQSAIMPTRIGVMGALAPSDEGAANPSETASVFADNPLTSMKESISSGFSLFYTPTYVIDDMGIWLTSDQKQNGGASNCSTTFAKLLASTVNITPAQGAEERYRWYIVGQGAKVFHEAMQEYSTFSRRPLSPTHDFFFINPQVPLSLLYDDLRAAGIDFSRDAHVVHRSMAPASRAHQLFDPKGKEENGYFNMYKSSYHDFVRVRSTIMASKKVLNSRSSSTCFSDLVAKLTSTISGTGSWGDWDK